MFSLSPSTVIFYCILIFNIDIIIIYLHTDELVWSDLCNILKLIKQNNYDNSLLEMFRDNDKYISFIYRDDDGKINFTDFMNIVEHTNYFDVIYIIQEKFINYFFPEKHYIQVLNRRLKIDYIHTYALRKKQFPKESCKEKYNRCIKKIPPTYKYDYYCELGKISYFDIVAAIIEKHINLRIERKKFLIKNLQICKNPTIYTVDMFYFSYINDNGNYRLKNIVSNSISRTSEKVSSRINHLSDSENSKSSLKRVNTTKIYQTSTGKQYIFKPKDGELPHSISVSQKKNVL